MLTIKKEIDNTLTISQSEFFTIAYPDSSVWAVVEDLRKKFDVPEGIGTIFYSAPSYLDDECKEEYMPEQFGASDRKSDAGGKALAVISQIEDNDDLIGGVLYEYIYPNDSIYVTNEQGKTVFSLAGIK
ncbi:hypothetical protein FHQ28_05575 [Pasteurellaceae bacterium USgator11]|nr:hypothetical protein FHQ20_07835 [Pasteurellaceae bacterium USgator41]TNG96467.1 hypothetical protein FHQ19_02010 [Pasteurellaceae bacterium UScroc12]TNH00451.1 hypothetical protein FHQ24_03615 [Pasteurellaceae bacterium UScroc31]TNH01718.1 hypothetical protein FHQ28_05575 [Pasteurellaceae bacterium USgator11]